QQSVASLFNGHGPALADRALAEQPHKAGRDLAVNLSLHGYGVAHFAAQELRGRIEEILDMLSSAEILAAYGVRDVWQLVERVSTIYLGGALNGVRYRTTAQSGGQIILWLADHANILASVADPSSATLNQLFRDTGPTGIQVPVERWLAVT